MAYRCDPSVSWSVERYGVRLRHGETGEICFIDEPDAAAWDLFTRGYSAEKIAELFRWIAGLDPDSSKSKVTECLKDWTTSGFLVDESDDG